MISADRRQTVPRLLDRVLRMLLAAVVIGLASGCATLPPNAGQDPRDPWEKVNRNVFVFNEGFDANFLKPVAELYAKLPDGIRDCLSNAFFNLRGPSTAINNTLQGKPAEAVSDVGRFVVNTTIGLVGCFDVATELGLEKHYEDFGQTLGVWGFGPGPYLVVPFLGPSNVRDAVGIFGVETLLDLNFWIDKPALEYSIFALRIVNLRAELLPTDRLINEAALDPYSFIRDGFLQRRRNLVYDGNPPRELDPEDNDAAVPEAATTRPPDTVSSPAVQMKPESAATGSAPASEAGVKPQEPGK
jgi:phospholipid-binding lipoprotein MlaA